MLEGEIWLELDDGAEVHLREGDVAIQCGTRHAWRNKGSVVGHDGLRSDRSVANLSAVQTRKIHAGNMPLQFTRPEEGAMHYDCLIIGSGHGGAQAATSLRQHDFQGSIGVLSEDPDAPYERPPLSKDYLVGSKTFDRILIRPTDFWASRNIDLVLGNKVVRVDANKKHVLCANGATVGYGQLIWSAGGRPRRMSCPGHDLQGIHAVRTRFDVDRLNEDLVKAEKVVIVGGGYIGLEAAAALSKLGKTVTVVEAMNRVLARVAAEPLSRFYEREHCDHGVDVRLETGVESFIGSDGRLTGVMLQDGATLPADIAIVGIGIVPCVEPLIEAGAAGNDGVDVDEFCRTNLPHVFAIGDCARVRSAHGLRIESVQNAHDQATAVAKTALR